MKKSITPEQIRQNNRNLIYQYIYQHKKVSQQDISYDLRLSRPTVTANLNSMETERLIQKNGLIDSEFVGRKPSAYSIVPTYRVGIGVEIRRREVPMMAIDLYGEKIERKVYQIEFQDTDSYYQEVCEKVLDFISSVGLKAAQILGIGFAMPGLVSADRTTMIYGKILSCTGLTVQMFSQRLPYPCRFVHDADSAAISEMWASPQLKNAFYLSLSKHLGAAVICNGIILTGKHGHSGTIEHIQAEPDGKPCYCGKRGCIETVCSISALLSQEETLDEFFEKLRHGDASVEERWEKFLKNLATTINLLHLVYDTDFVLGGHLAPYLCDADIRRLHEFIRQLTPFEETQDFILLSKMPTHSITTGAALTYIQDFLDHTAK